MAKFEVSHKKRAGRKVGSCNKDKVQLRERALALDIDPFETLLYFSAGDWKSLGYKSEYETTYTSSGTPIHKLTISTECRKSAAAEACQYMYPKLRAMEVEVSTKKKRPLKEIPSEMLNELLKINGKKQSES